MKTDNSEAPIESPEESLVGNSLEPTDIDWFAILRPIVYDNAPNSNQRKVVARDYQDDRVVCPSHEVGITQGIFNRHILYLHSY